MKLFITAFLLVLTAGYSVGILFVDHTTSGTPDGLAAEFRGNEGETGQSELKFEKSPREIYTFLHNHVFSLSLLFFCVGAIFYFSSAPRGLKTFLLVEPFIAIVTTFGGIWMTRFASPGFSWLVIISGVSMLACYGVMFVLILRDLWSAR
ncbi:MAG TPA: hypothetical protein VI932_02330 [Bacteroidota bacterium]|nr:hypothetical protein [Bacteroidota bacterium]